MSQSLPASTCTFTHAAPLTSGASRGALRSADGLGVSPTVLCVAVGFIAASIFSRAAPASAEVPVAPPGTYSTSWLGNSFMKVNAARGGQWEMVPEQLEDMATSSNGRVFTAGYHETEGGGASFDGATGAFDGRYKGFNSGFGEPANAVAADNRHVYFGTKNGVKRYPHGGGSTNTSFLAGHAIMGVALKGGKLFLSDYTDNRIRVYDADTLAEISNWPVARPTRLTIDNSNRVWVIQEAADTPQKVNDGPLWKGGAILSFSFSGKAGASITDFENPLALKFNRANNQLYVGGLNRHSQIWRYDRLSGKPRRAGTFGQLNGIFAGTAGQFSNRARLHWIKAIDFDLSGNVYVACIYGTFWGQAVEKFSSSGALAWRVFCGSSLDGGSIDPASEQDVYTKFHHYKMDWNKATPGSEWSLRGFTANRFKYPGDPRVDAQTDVNVRSLGYGAVRIRERLFMIRSHQFGYRFEMFRFSPATDGEVGIPSVSMPNGGDHVIKRDANGNGRFDADESFPGDKGYNQYWEITPSGDLFTLVNDGQSYGTVVKYPFQGFDAVGNPIYTAATTVSVQIPAAFRDTHRTRRTVYDEGADRMYLLGSPLSNGGNADDAVTRVACFRDWSRDTRQLAWSAEIPLNDTQYTPGTGYGGGQANSMRQAGKYLFLAYGYGHVRILDKSSGALVGTLTQNVNGWTGTAGQIDAAYALNVHQRKNGEFVLLIENASWGNITMFRWKPEAIATAIAHQSHSAASAPTFGQRRNSQ